MSATPEEFEYDVFLNHSSNDKAVVLEIAERLKSDGIRVWLDAWEIKPGDSIPSKLEEGLARSRILALCMSASASGSDWAQLEAGTFRFRDPLNKERRFLPLRLDNEPIKSSLSQFRHISWLLPEREQSYSMLLEACRSPLLSTNASPVTIEAANLQLSELPASARWAKECIIEGIEAIEGLFDRNGKPSGIATGFRDLDLISDGFHPGGMFVIASKPRVGKTTLALNIVEHVAVDSKIPSAVFILSSGRRHLSQRLLCSRARVNVQKLRDGFVTERDVPSLTTAASQISEAKLLIDDVTGLTLQDFEQRLRFYVDKHSVKFVVIDDLYSLRCGSVRGNRQDEIAAISAAIKTLITELKISVLVLVPLTIRDRVQSYVESFELDADLIALLVRESVDEGLSNSGDEVELIIAKHRNGPIGVVKFNFVKEYARFESVARGPGAGL